MARTREEMMEALREAGETVAHNIGDENLANRYNEKFGIQNEATNGGDPKPKPEAPKTKKVIIHSNDRENDEFDMVVGHKGKLHRVKIGEPVDLDVELIGVINHAVEDRNVPVLDKDGQPTGKVVVRPRKRYIVEPVIEE